MFLPYQCVFCHIVLLWRTSGIASPSGGSVSVCWRILPLVPRRACTVIFVLYMSPSLGPDSCISPLYLFLWDFLTFLSFFYYTGTGGQNLIPSLRIGILDLLVQGLSAKLQRSIFIPSSLTICVWTESSLPAVSLVLPLKRLFSLLCFLTSMVPEAWKNYLSTPWRVENYKRKTTQKWGGVTSSF